MTTISFRIALVLSLANVVCGLTALSYGAPLLTILLVGSILQTLVAYLHQRRDADFKILLGLAIIGATPLVRRYLVDDELLAQSNLLKFVDTVMNWLLYAITSLAVFKAVLFMFFLDDDTVETETPQA